MVNFDYGPAQILGTLIIFLSCFLYSIRIKTWELSKDSDVIIFSIGTTVGGILIFQGWRLDPLLLFGQFMTTFVAASFALESLRLRSLLFKHDKTDETYFIKKSSRSNNVIVRAQIWSNKNSAIEDESEDPLTPYNEDDGA